jgi:hypothetical protein
MRALFARVAGHIVAATAPGALWHGLRVCTLDGCQVKVPDSDDNRAAFGSSGTADDSAAFPMVRIVLAVARAGRALLAATIDTSRVGEQPMTPGSWRRIRTCSPPNTSTSWLSEALQLLSSTSSTGV